MPVGVTTRTKKKKKKKTRLQLFLAKVRQFTQDFLTGYKAEKKCENFRLLDLSIAAKTTVTVDALLCSQQL